MKRDVGPDLGHIFPEEEPPPERELPAYVRPILPIGRAVHDWWRELFILTVSSIVWGILVITVIGLAPATAALMVVARAAALHEGPTLRLFFTAFRAYFARSWLVGIVQILSIVIILFDFPFYYSFASQGGFFAPLGALFLLYIALSWLQTLYYAWAMLVTRTDLSLGQMLRNGALITLRYPFHHLLSGAFLALLLFAGSILPPLLILALPPIWALLALHNLYLLAPEIVPEDVEGLSIVS
jgi:uncharacterized membrane protein YesL